MYNELLYQPEIESRKDIQKLQTITTLNFDYFSWLLFYCRCIREYSTAKDISGMTLSRHELVCIGIDCEELLSLLIANDIDNVWVANTQRFEYLTYDEVEKSAVPGDYCEAVHLVRLHLKPTVGAYPFITILKYLSTVCQKLERKYYEFLPPYYNQPCEDPHRFTQALINGESDPILVARELDLWRLRVNERIEVLKEQESANNIIPFTPHLSDEMLLQLFSPNHIDLLEQNDPRIQREVPRTLISKMIHKTRRTIRNWERDGNAPRGVIWPQPRRVSQRTVMYFLPQYLPAIKELVPRIRNRTHDTQLREELFEQKYAC